MSATPLLSLDEYETMAPEALATRIDALRRRLGDELLILGHHYQKEAILRHCDLRGDSFQLSEAAAESTACRAIVFCGVHFMAETADILLNTQRKREHRLAAKVPEFVPVVLPDVKAGCPMAEMATAEQVRDAWVRLSDFIDPDVLVPITYVNSTAEIKAFCGYNGGLSCTSSNAAAVLRRAFERNGNNGRVLFVPDRHLGCNTAIAMGIPKEEHFLWTPGMELAEADIEALKRCRIILWNGFCHVHRRFEPGQIDAVRAGHPGVRVIVHPECSREIVEKADENGSTSFIIDTIARSAPGSIWAVGTEFRLVERLAKTYPDKTILNLAPQPSICETMDRITPAKLCRSLDMIAISAPENIIRVPERIASDALLCLQRMLACKQTVVAENR
ncbi:MAG TPA: quinolinate synthase [Planctomycetaceae bacterium]|nr:quinolinate synthase [Planctomycetaceae bacterium]